MKNNFSEQARSYVYYAMKNLAEMKELGMYDEMVYLVLKQELTMLNSTIEKIISNKEIPNDIRRSQLKTEVIEATKHVANPSFIETLDLFDIDTTKINTRLINFLEMSVDVICAQLGDDATGSNSKFIEIQKDGDALGDDVPNVFDLSIPYSSSGAIISIDDNGNCYVQPETRRLIVTALFKQDWLLLRTSQYVKTRLNMADESSLWSSYSRVVGTAYVAFSNKFGLDILKLVKNYNENKDDPKFLSDKNLLKIEDTCDVLEYLKLFYIEDRVDKAKELYDILKKECGEKIINRLLPERYVKSLTETSSMYIVPKEVQEMIKEKEEECEKSPDPKPKRWLNSVKKIPFGVVKKDKMFNFVNGFIDKYGKEYGWKMFMDVYRGIKKCKDKKVVNEWRKYMKDRRARLSSIRQSLDDAVYGHENVKDEIINLASEWMNGGMKGSCIGLEGPPGNGKTSIGKNGICKAFVDENGDPFPFVYISLGAANNGSYLFGHHYTFQGSIPGKIASGLMSSKCMNPIFYFDELDKISQTESGQELISTLIHITDSTQNDSFEDMYFSGIKLDLSKCLFVFSFNDINAIDRILVDRLHIIKTNPLNVKDKVVIGRDYLMKDICNNIGWNLTDVDITDKSLSYLIRSYTLESGVRRYKRHLTKIIRTINHCLSEGRYKSRKMPFKITNKDIDTILDVNNKIKVKKTHQTPMVGMVNGLYCIPGYGIGGTIPLQARRTFKKNDKDFNNITVTGNLGKVMSESVECAKTAISNILSQAEITQLETDGISIHLHAMDAASQKEGPSAGGAITLCLYSLITRQKVRNNVALTGEITLDGQITAIGGVPEKVNGGHSVGCNIILLPEENREDYDMAVKDGWFDNDIRVLKKTEWSDTVKKGELCVKFVSTIQEIIKMAIIEENDIKPSFNNHKINKAKNSSEYVVKSTK